MNLLQHISKIIKTEDIWVSRLLGDKSVGSHVVVDVETFVHNHRHFVYAIGGFDGVKFIVEYLPCDVSIKNLEEASEEMIDKFLSRFLRGNQNKVIYCHNLSFDGHFLLKVLGKYTFNEVRIIKGDSENQIVGFDIHKGKTYSSRVMQNVFPEEIRGTFARIVKNFDVIYKGMRRYLDPNVPSQNEGRNRARAALLECLTTFKGRNQPIRFRDSYRLLPMRLRDLCELFQVPHQKGIFPHKFVTLNTLYYKGPKPAQSFYGSEMSDAEYVTLLDKFEVRMEALKYLEFDCRGLYEVLDMFKQKIFEHGQVDITKAYSLSGVAFRLYRREALVELYRFTRAEDREIRLGYYGGNTEVFVPHVKGALYLYDINSLYSSCMKSPMPRGRPVWYTADKVKSEWETFFGFVECTIFCPSTIRYPVLPVKSGIGTEARQYMPIGTFRGLWFSEEIRFALRLGYEIREIHRGFAFLSGDLFSNFVDKYYQAKSITESPVERKLFKLILNSVYGKIGQRLRDEYYMVLFSDDLSELAEKIEILECQQIICESPLTRYFVTFTLKPSYLLELEDKVEYSDFLIRYNSSRCLGSVAVSAAISSYGRIRQYEIIHKYKDHVCYTDTDSFVTTVPLDEPMQGKLGQLRFEGCFEEGYFLAPKVYGLKKENGEVRLRMAGVKTSLLKYDDYVALYHNGKVTYQWEKIQVRPEAIYARDRVVILEGDLSNKRRLVKNDLGLWIDTEPYFYEDLPGN